jgi:hypothetical protein
MTTPKTHAPALRTAWLAAACLASAAHAVPVAGQGTWQTTLQARDLDGDRSNGAEAYYDTVLHITWLADAFQARTSRYQARPYYGAGDSLIRDLAVEWADNLVLHGISDWRLPRSFDTGTPGCGNLTVGGECGWNVNPASSELAHMFHTTLGNISYLSPQGTVAPGHGLTNTGPFSNVYNGPYWSETDHDQFNGWNFSFNFGSQGPTPKNQGSAVWAVLDGDRGTPLSAVPEPAAWLLMAGGGLLLAVRRRTALRRALVA